MADDTTADEASEERADSGGLEDDGEDRFGDIIVLGVLAFIAAWFQVGLLVALVKGGINWFTVLFVPANLGIFWLVYVLTQDLFPDRPRGKTIGLTFAAEGISLAAIMGPIALVALIGSYYG